MTAGFLLVAIGLPLVALGIFAVGRLIDRRIDRAMEAAYPDPRFARLLAEVA